MKERTCLIRSHIGIIALLLCFGVLPFTIFATEMKTKTKAVSEGREDSLILQDVRVEEIPVLVASNDHFILEWIEREVSGEEEELVTGLTGQPKLPMAYSLSQNYPNPFNPSTTITFDIPGTPGEKQPVNLVIYDMRGRRVRSLVDADYEPGSYMVTWKGMNDRGSNVSSGIYLYTLRAGDKQFTRKMTILK